MAPRASLVALLALTGLTAHPARAAVARGEVDDGTQCVIDALRERMALEPLATADSPRAKRTARQAAARSAWKPSFRPLRLLGRLRLAMVIIAAYRLVMRALDRFLPIPEDDDTDALDYVDFERYLYEPSPMGAFGARRTTRIPSRRADDES